MRAWLAALLRTTADHLQPTLPAPPSRAVHVEDVQDALRKYRAQQQLTFARR